MNMKLTAEQSVLVIIDIQTKLWNTMFEKTAVLENAQKLVKAVRVLNIPIILTEQNPQGLGPTASELMQLMPDVKPLPKFCFSCYQDPGFQQALRQLNRRQVLLCGIESHVCVHQTALELLKDGYDVHVAADAVSSRIQYNKEIALERMQSEGVRLTVAEMAIFEILGKADSPSFKEILKVIK
jgi:nicotinamidase-related amidase